MCGKYYPITNALFKDAGWHGVDWTAGDFCVCASHQQSVVRYAPLYIHQFRIVKIRSDYQSYEKIPNVPDRLRWCRQSKGLLQTEMAERVGLTYNAYKNLEAGTMQHIPQDTAQRLAELYDIPVADLLDAYNQFLYDGQTARIRAYRESLALGKKPFARQMGIPIRSLQAWESGTKTLSRQSWEKYFQDAESQIDAKYTMA